MRQSPGACQIIFYRAICAAKRAAIWDRLWVTGIGLPFASCT
ncbi:hypothetical protein GECvBMG_gp234 [Salmonella phage GEC_vB_MG]|nr:hypothetical protein GECvBMG_gp234 [Salmonella phage GEC_vB_MG]